MERRCVHYPYLCEGEAIFFDLFCEQMTYERLTFILLLSESFQKNVQISEQF